ncbi:MAG TPA: hypothetical protein VK154_04455 [Chitinophagales bacterium]|nr:hypothetical protein [Chitinophagales bacterium]
MKMKIVLPVLVCATLLLASFMPLDYTGNNLLLLLNADASAKDFKPVKEFWLLDKNLQNPYGGIKLSLNSMTGKVQSILIAGEECKPGGVPFFKCTSPLPFNLSLNDDTAALRTKLGEGIKLMGRNTMKFYMDDVAVEVSYTDLKSGKVQAIKFYNEVKPLPAKVVEIAKAPTAKDKLDDKRKELENTTFVSSTPAVVKTETAPPGNFKKAVLNVFASYKESSFYSIKDEQRSYGNFWNYQYTYSTKLKIPGEKFNMLYSFPFPTSQLDFVSVIKEGDAYDASFQNIYKDFEKKLMQNFPQSEGWVSACKPNKESKTLSDLEFSNDRYGSIILDYSKSPKGRHILYLRFLLYSN